MTVSIVLREFRSGAICNADVPFPLPPSDSDYLMTYHERVMDELDRLDITTARFRHIVDEPTCTPRPKDPSRVTWEQKGRLAVEFDNATDAMLFRLAWDESGLA